MTPHGYTDIPLDMHNCIFRYDTNYYFPTGSSNPRIVAPFLRPVIAAIQRKQPTWTFVADRQGTLNNNNERPHHYFVIYSGDGEALGSIWQEFRGSDYTHAVNNPRLQSTRMRGSATYAKDPKKAAGIVLKNFYPTTPIEQLAETRRTVGSRANNAASSKHMDLYRAFETLSAPLRGWLETPEAAEVVTQYLTLEDKQLDMLHTFPKTATDAREMANLNVQVRIAGYDVVVRGNDYFVRDVKSEDPTPMRYTEELLPDHIKGHVAMLKLVEDGTAIPGVGIRGDATSFWVPPKEDTT